MLNVDEGYLNSLSYTLLRALSVKLGVLVQDDPGLDLLRQRVRQCEWV